jgi:hypothetical protein
VSAEPAAVPPTHADLAAARCVGVRRPVGMTDELPIGHLHERIIAVDALLGPADHHSRTLGATGRG